MRNNELNQISFTSRTRTYYFDIKESELGDMYLKITESKKSKSGFERNTVMVFEEDIRGFLKTLQNSWNSFKNIQKERKPEPKKYDVIEIREKFPNAYKAWSNDDDDKLELLYCEGKTTKEIAAYFGRDLGAVRSRIKKLEIKEKYA